MISILDKISQKTAWVFYVVAGAAIVLMMLLTVFDVLMRLSVTLNQKLHWEFLGFFIPVAGTYELVSYLGSVAAAFAMAHTSIRKGHVSVSLIVSKLSPRWQGVIETLTGFCSIAFFSIIAWRAIVYANHMRESGEVSLTLQLPFYPFVWGIGLGSMAVCLALLVDLTQNIKKVFSR